MSGTSGDFGTVFGEIEKGSSPFGASHSLNGHKSLQNPPKRFRILFNESSPKRHQRTDIQLRCLLDKAGGIRGRAPRQVGVNLVEEVMIVWQNLVRPIRIDEYKQSPPLLQKHQDRGLSRRQTSDVVCRVVP